VKDEALKKDGRVSPVSSLTLQLSLTAAGDPLPAWHSRKVSVCLSVPQENDTSPQRRPIAAGSPTGNEQGCTPLPAASFE